MPLPTRPPRCLLGLTVAGCVLATATTWAQTETLPALRTSAKSSTSDLEKPPTYSLPSPTASSTRPTGTRSTTSRSSATASSSDSGPDPSLFDGSNFPPEERPERGLIAQFEMPGQDPKEKVQGPGDEEGNGPGEKGGDGSPDGQGGIQVAVNGPQIPGLNVPGMGSGGMPGGLPGLPGMGGAPGTAAPPPLPTFDMPDPSSSASGAGDPGKPGKPGAPGQLDAPPPPPGAQGEPLEKPNAVKIGDPNAKLAESDTPRASASRTTEKGQGEDRMAVKAASGNQPVNRDRGTERGVDIPSDL